jgi:putative ABC transport system ATP-binding protein
MAQPVILAKKLSKVYTSGNLQTVALADVSFLINKGEFVAIMGPSGSGKSTLMHILGALDLPTGGTYELDGQNIQNMTEDQLADIRNRKIGFIFQAFNLLPRTTALKNVMLPLMYAGVNYQTRLARAKQYLEMVGLGERLNHHSNQLSGGQQQRVAIARGLAMEPALLLADEPTGNLDDSATRGIIALFRRLHINGATVIIATHDKSLLQEVPGRHIHLSEGVIA